MSGFYTNEQGKAIKFAEGNVSLQASMPVGSIFPSAIPIVDRRVHLLDGTTISQEGTYQNFAILINALITAGYNISCTQEEFDTSISTYGQCGKFVVDNNAKTIRLPKVTKFIEGLSDMTKIGSMNEAGLPDITGTFGETIYALSGSTTGAFKQTRTTGHNVPLGSWAEIAQMEFKASYSNDNIYGKSETVQPESISYPYYIVLASGFKTNADIIIDPFIDDVEKIKSEYVKSATIVDDILKITDQNNNTIEFQGGSGSSEDCVTTNTEQEISAYKTFLEGIGISTTFNVEAISGTTSQTAVNALNLKDGIYYFPERSYAYLTPNSVTSFSEGIYIVTTKTNGGEGKCWLWFGERNGTSTIMKGYITSTGGTYEEIKTSGFIKTGETYTQNISCHYSGEKSVLSLTGHSTEGTFLDFVNFEDGIGKTCSIGINEEFKPVFIDKDGVESELGGGGSANIIWKEWS